MRNFLLFFVIVCCRICNAQDNYYNSKKEKFDQARNYQRRAKEATARAELYKRKANNTRDKAAHP